MGETLRNAEPVETPGFHNRVRQNWLPLLAIARLAGPDAERRVWKAAQQIEATAKAPDSASLGVQLLEDIHTLFDATEEEGLLSRDIVADLVADEEKP
jgi:hypothetical protein